MQLRLVTVVSVFKGFKYICNNTLVYSECATVVQRHRAGPNRWHLDRSEVYFICWLRSVLTQNQYAHPSLLSWWGLSIDISIDRYVFDIEAIKSRKSRGGGTCFYINERWCTDITVLKKMCSSDLEETLFINCKPFYSPREFCSFILVSVYIPPQAHVSSALQKLADQITDTEQQHPDSVLIILGDFNKANLSRELPTYRQHITCPTRDSNILDHCYTAIKDAYHSVPRAALGLSDHCLVNLIPTYRQKLKSAKPVLRTVKRWTNEAEQDLKACFDLTDWTVFEAAANDLDKLTETVTSYISFCEDMCIPTRTHLTYNNDKPWFTAKLRQLHQAKEDAYR